MFETFYKKVKKNKSLKKIGLDYELPKVVFFADRHSYLAQGVELTSATGLISKYKWDFEREYWLVSGAIKLACPKIWRAMKDQHFPGVVKAPKKFFSYCRGQMSPEQIEATKTAKKQLEYEWEVKNATACYRGTKFHERMEKEDLTSKKGVENPFTGKMQKIVARPDLTYSDNATVCDDLSDLEDGYYPELLIFYFVGGKGVVGQVDRAWIWTDKKTGERFYASDDWKTNWKKKRTGGFGSFKGILTHLRETKTNEYALQASIYAYMMELSGFQIKHLQITYVKDFDIKEVDVEVLPYMYEEVEHMFEKHFE